MERRSRRDVELHFVDNHFPERQLGLRRWLLEQPPQIHPEEQPRVALQAPDAHLSQTLREILVPLHQPFAALGDELSDEIIVRKHGGDQVLRLGQNQAEARHLARAAGDDIVVGVNDVDSEAGKAEVFGEAVDNCWGLQRI